MAKAASKNAKVKDLKASAEAKNWTKLIEAIISLLRIQILYPCEQCSL